MELYTYGAFYYVGNQAKIGAGIVEAGSEAEATGTINLILQGLPGLRPDPTIYIELTPKIFIIDHNVYTIIQTPLNSK